MSFSAIQRIYAGCIDDVNVDENNDDDNNNNVYIISNDCDADCDEHY